MYRLIWIIRIVLVLFREFFLKVVSLLIFIFVKGYVGSFIDLVEMVDFNN